MGGNDETVQFGQVEKIKSYTMVMGVNIPIKDKEKHKMKAAMKAEGG